MPSYDEMQSISMDRLNKSGFKIGQSVQVKKKTGVIASINPLFYDMEDIAVYVDYSNQDKHNLVKVSNLVPA
jgi:hypothetical protein